MKTVKTAPFNRYQALDMLKAAVSSFRRNDIALYTGNDDNIAAGLSGQIKNCIIEGYKGARALRG